MSDPRKAKTLGEAAQNPDGTFNLFKAMSWMSAAVTGGRGIPEEEVREIYERVKAKKEGRP
jgi:hypothetical protein